MVSGISASLISSVTNDTGVNDDVNQYCRNTDQVELLHDHEMWPELGKWSLSSSRVSRLPSPLNFNRDSPFFSEGENWPSFISTSCLVQPSCLEASRQNSTSAQFSCPSADLVSNDSARPPVLDAGLLRQLLLKRAEPNTSTLAPPSTNEMKTTAPTASTPFTLPSTKHKRSASNGLDRFTLGRPSKIRPAGQIYRSDCSSHTDRACGTHDPPRGNITLTSPAPSVHATSSKHPLKSTKMACESHRRKQMSGLLSTLRTLLPKEFPQVTVCLCKISYVLTFDWFSMVINVI